MVRPLSLFVSEGSEMSSKKDIKNPMKEFKRLREEYFAVINETDPEFVKEKEQIIESYRPTIEHIDNHIQCEKERMQNLQHFQDLLKQETLVVTTISPSDGLIPK